MSNNSTTVSLRDFWAHASQNIDVPIQPSSTFIPDNWTRVLATGLQQLDDWGDKKILEIGSGCGINILGMAKTYPNLEILGADYVDQAVDASNQLISQHKLNAVTRQSDSFSSFTSEELKDVSRFFTCTPQMLGKEGVDLNEGDNASHYCLPIGEEKWDNNALPLQARLLRDANEKAPHMDGVFNLAVRPPIELLENLFAEHGRSVKILHSEIVPQHLGTCLQPFADLESQGHTPSTFYADPKGKHEIPGSEARERQLKTLNQGADPQSSADNIYHRLIVAHASPYQPQ